MTFNYKIESVLLLDCYVCCYEISEIIIQFSFSDSIGDNSIAGDKRWAGSFGVNVDFVARTHCSVEFISTEDITVEPCFTPKLRIERHNNRLHIRFKKTEMIAVFAEFFLEITAGNLGKIRIFPH